MSVSERGAAHEAEAPEQPVHEGTTELSEFDRAALELDSEAVHMVHLDGMALMKMVKHYKDSHANHGATAWGALLGADAGGLLEVTNAFGLPGARERGEEEERSNRAAMAYMSEMLRLLRQVNADTNPVGMYQGAFLGPFLHTSVVEGLNTLSALMEHEGSQGRGKAVLLVHDYAQLAQGNLVVRAYRLAPSFIDAFRQGQFAVQGLIDHRLTFSSVLEELPVEVHNTALLDAFLATLNSAAPSTERVVPPTTRERLEAPPASHIVPDYMDLNLALDPVLVSSMETTLDSLESYSSEAGNVGYQARQIAREKARADAYVARRTAENESRQAAGLAPLPIEDVSRLFKIPPEPNRLESLLLLHQLDGAASRLNETAAVGAMQLRGAYTGTA